MWRCVCVWRICLFFSDFWLKAYRGRHIPFPPPVVAMAPKRGSYNKSQKQYPETVATPTTTQEVEALSRAIQATQQSITRWDKSQPENCARAKAFLQLQEAARTSARRTMDKDVLREQALAGKAAYVKQAIKCRNELDKLCSLGQHGYDLAVDSNQTDASMQETQSAATTPVSAVAAADAAIAAQQDKFRAECEAIDRGEFLHTPAEPSAKAATTPDSTVAAIERRQRALNAAATPVPVLAAMEAESTVAVEADTKAAVPSAVSVVDSMTSTVSRALTYKLSSHEVANLIVEYAGEVAPPGISCEDWLFVVKRGAFPRAVLYCTTPDDVRREMQNYDRSLGPGHHWRVEQRIRRDTILQRQFAMTPGIAERLLAEKLVFELQRWGRYSDCRILDVNHAGAKFQYIRNAKDAKSYWCSFNNNDINCAVSAALFVNITD